MLYSEIINAPGQPPALANGFTHRRGAAKYRMHISEAAISERDCEQGDFRRNQQDMSLLQTRGFGSKPGSRFNPPGGKSEGKERIGEKPYGDNLKDRECFDLLLGQGVLDSKRGRREYQDADTSRGVVLVWHGDQEEGSDQKESFSRRRMACLSMARSTKRSMREG